MDRTRQLDMSGHRLGFDCGLGLVFVIGRLRPNNCVSEYHYVSEASGKLLRFANPLASKYKDFHRCFIWFSGFYSFLQIIKTWASETRGRPKKRPIVPTENFARIQAGLNIPFDFYMLQVRYTIFVEFRRMRSQELGTTLRDERLPNLCSFPGWLIDSLRFPCVLHSHRLFFFMLGSRRVYC